MYLSIQSAPTFIFFVLDKVCACVMIEKNKISIAIDILPIRFRSPEDWFNLRFDKGKMLINTIFTVVKNTTNPY